MSYRRPKFPEDHFLRLPNAWARDGNLRPNAKAMLMSILSHDPDWDLSTAQLMRETGLGRDAIQAATRHMLALGYLVEVEQTREDGTGRWGGNDYLVTDCVGIPAPPTGTANPHFSGLNVRIDPLRDEPVPGHPAPGGTARKKTPGEKTDESPTDSPSDGQLSLVPRSPEDSFNAFWAAYPKKVGKDAARRAWAKAIRRADAEKIIDVVSRYPFRPDRQFVKDPSTWLNAGCWEDDLEAVSASNRGGRVTSSAYRPPYQNPDPTAHPDAFAGSF